MIDHTTIATAISAIAVSFTVGKSLWDAKRVSKKSEVDELRHEVEQLTKAHEKCEASIAALNLTIEQVMRANRELTRENFEYAKQLLNHARREPGENSEK